MRTVTFSRIAGLLALSGAALLTGCVPLTPIKEVAGNADAYSARALSITALAPSVRAKLPAPGSQPLGFRKLVFTGATHIVGAGNQSLDSEFESTFYNDRDDGTVRNVHIGKRNGLPVDYLVALSYRNVAWLIDQSGPFNVTYMPPRLMVRSIEQWPGDLADIPENGTFTFEAGAGREGVLVSGPRQTVTCTSGTNYPASRLHPQIPGQAIDLNCVQTRDSGVQFRKTRRVFLRQFGIAMIVEAITAGSTATMTVKTFQVE